MALKKTKPARIGGRRQKYNAAGEHVDGIWMASKAEAERFRQLQRMEMNGLIENLETQVSFPLTVNNVIIATYRADFRYDVAEERGISRRSIIEDVKGMSTPEFLLKKRLFEALYRDVIHVIPGSDVARHWVDRIPD